MGLILIIILILLLVGTIPGWSYNRNWGYAPMGGMTILIIVLIILLFLGFI